jgi:predicted Fe-Mo cluster-binding NifX family protein
MKIACITEDGQTISQHFGRAPYYLVLTIENDTVVHKEMRDKLGHQHFAAEESAPTAPGSVIGNRSYGNAAQAQVEHGPRHGTDPASHDRHVSMAQAIADCQVLLCRGMGYGAYQSMQQFGIVPLVTEEADIDAAVQAYLQGRLQDHPERLH